MSFEDFYSNFDDLEICHLGPEVFNEIAKMVRKSVFREATTWKSYLFDGKWNKKNRTAGGCITDPTFANNPQYIVTLKSDRVESDGKCTVIFAVLQKYRRELQIQGFKNHNIGFFVYKLKPGINGKQDASFFKHNRPVAQTKTFSSTREVTFRIRLPPGMYLVVPCTYKPNQEAEFLLRVFCTGGIKPP
uniref:Peptidase C2 calpain domain-containing protein n=1 Tax=Panagrolaimus sp. ES5 TaxID=591445 RepID=A0AC34FGH1_9BILA